MLLIETERNFTVLARTEEEAIDAALEAYHDGELGDVEGEELIEAQAIAGEYQAEIEDEDID